LEETRDKVFRSLRHKAIYLSEKSRLTAILLIYFRFSSFDQEISREGYLF
jgi:hypothetical protein